LKKLVFFLGATIALGVGTLLVTKTTHAADHLDAPAVSSQPLADINDVFAWMAADGTHLNLAMTISPGDDGTRHLSPSVLYVFHVTASAAFGAAGTETKIVCKFTTDTHHECWVGNVDYVSGDANMLGMTPGVFSLSGKIHLYVGRTADPFFFNLQGFRDAANYVENAGALPLNAAGCPDTGVAATNNSVIGTPLRNCLFGDPNAGATRTTACPGSPGVSAAPCSTTSADCFASLNVISIVLVLDKSLVTTAANPVIGVWASTHAGM
jgi:hypothetical protein